MYLHDQAVHKLFRDQAGPAVELLFHNILMRSLKNTNALVKAVNELAAKYGLIQRFTNAFVTPKGSVEFTVAPATLPETVEGYKLIARSQDQVQLTRKLCATVQVASVINDRGLCVGYVEKVETDKFSEIRAVVGTHALPIHFTSVYQAGTYLIQNQPRVH